MIEILVENPLLLLFLITAIGYPIGGSNRRRQSGVVAVLFVGLAVGAIDQRLQLPAIMFEFGLVTFMYTIGLSSGPGFFASLRRKGLRDDLFVFILLVLAAILALLLGQLLGLKPAVTAGLYAGSLTNTPVIASVIDTISRTAPADQVTALVQPAHDWLFRGLSCGCAPDNPVFSIFSSAGGMSIIARKRLV